MDHGRSKGSFDDDDGGDGTRRRLQKIQRQRQQCASTNGMVELDDLVGPTRRMSYPPPDGRHRDVGSDDDDDVCDDYDRRPRRIPDHRNRRRNRKRVVHLLGRILDRASDRRCMRDVARGLYWLTYRRDLVVPLRPYSSPPSSLAWLALHGGGMGGVGGGGGGEGGGIGMRTDAGWGCMLRSAQMMMAQAVRRHYDATNDAGTTPLSSSSSSSSSSSLERVARWFADFPNRIESEEDDCDHDHTDVGGANYGDGGLDYHWYSLHQMVAAGLELGILPGEWYGPTMACRVLSILNGMHCERRRRTIEMSRNRGRRGGRGKRGGEGGGIEGDDIDDDDVGVGDATTPTCDVFRVHVATEGCIYLDAVRDLVASPRLGGIVGIASEKKDPKNTINDEAHDDDASPIERIDDPLRPSMNNNTPSSRRKKRGECDDDEGGWHSSLLLLLPLRLGLKSINATDYGSTLSRLMGLPQSVGMLGGTPRHALWFYGADAVDPTARGGAAVGCGLGDGDDDDAGGYYVEDEDDDVDDDDDDDADDDRDGGDGGWYGLDPHVVQLAPRGTRVPVGRKKSTTTDEEDGDGEDPNDGVGAKMTTTATSTATTATSLPNHRWQVQLTETYLRSLHISSTVTHVNHERSIPLSKLDPSCALGFYVRDRVDFARFVRSIEMLTSEHCKPNGLPEIITVTERAPKYELDVSSAMYDMAAANGVGGGKPSIADCLDGLSMKSNALDGEDDDDDDFVLI